jgi:hypothetical protein
MVILAPGVKSALPCMLRALESAAKKRLEEITEGRAIASGKAATAKLEARIPVQRASASGSLLTSG